LIAPPTRYANGAWVITYPCLQEAYNLRYQYARWRVRAAPPARRHHMKELTLSKILEEAFERARDLDALLGVRLESFADSVRMASPAFAEAVDRRVTRLTLSGSGATAPAVGDPMPSFMLPDDQGHLVRLEEMLAKGPVALSFHRGTGVPIAGSIRMLWPRRNATSNRSVARSSR
jgi:hypothetical protein